ncbi:3-hydroxyacyl-ACP dehydratase FabZ [Fimbriimonas ginsengisoli]|uniref:3-hydroxyacyl-[acyl-carrier-protein] dehydratase FabZ n=1 Tax=Fimbriimonas ginsengisoli Gsoil 348 TaxID=661478 RepID=A0A068NQF6_FIMGI|nr:3-hydroxyacyl-ACP dehydratase FabZ [Fimbriimonas ginsengisoli]AIE85651.1 beta-hydroxyacyl-(acyl-carrier-protein) dehydratase FabZ [Fimbriimonas ginsengisoli Gsoil 348]
MVKIEEILECLPHRYPMLLVDRILEMDEVNMKCRGLKNVTINEPFFQGHYPGHPIMPGVLIIESMAQVGAALLLKSPTMSGRIPLIGAIDNVKFKRPVVPGDQLITDCEILWVRAGIGKMRSAATVDGDLAASMEMTFKLLDKGR